MTNYNVMALRGANITDEEYVETFGLDPSIAGSPKINDVMLDLAMQQNIDAGMDEMEAKKKRENHAKGIKKLLAQNGLMKK